MHDINAEFEKAKIIFWDFDGVIKDSVSVKTEAFERLFSSFGEDVAVKVRRHHEKNGGVSRFEKIPLYLKWGGVEADPKTIDEYCAALGKITLGGVVSSEWVPGVREYIQSNYKTQYFVLVTATPYEEIVEILKALCMSSYFKEVYGAPTTKSSAIQNVLSKTGISAENALFIGDSESDFNASVKQNVPFVLRKTDLNANLQTLHSGMMFEQLSYG